MVQVLVDYRHLAGVRLVDLSRTRNGECVKGTFLVSSRLSPQSKTYAAEVTAEPNKSRRDIIATLWVLILNSSVEDIRTFVYECARMPSLNERLDLFPLGIDDDSDKIDTSIVNGTIDGSLIRPASITSEQIDSLDASKLVGTIHPDRLRNSGLHFDMIDGTLDGSKVDAMSIDMRHIVSIDASVIVGVLDNVILAPGSVDDHHISEISWDKLVGRPSDAFLANIRLQDLSGQLKPEQLPRRIPPECVDLSSGLDLALFTHGHLPDSCFADNCIETRHIREVDASKLVGHIDGSLIAPGTIPDSALTTIDANSLTGDLQIDSIVARSILTDSLNCTEAGVNGKLSCANLEVGGDLLVKGDGVSVSGLLSCQSMRVQDDIVARRVHCRNVLTETLTATTIVATNMDADALAAQSIDAVSVESKSLRSREVRCESVVSREVDADSVNVHNSLIVKGTLHSDNVITHTLKAESAILSECCAQGNSSFMSASVEGLLEVQSLDVREGVLIHGMEASEVSIEGVMNAECVHVRGNARVSGPVHSDSDLVALGDVIVEGDFRAKDLQVSGDATAHSISCESLVVRDECTVDNATVTDSLDATSIACSHFRADSVLSAHVQTDFVEAGLVSCDVLEARAISSGKLTADCVDCGEAQTDLVVSSHIHVTQDIDTKFLTCSEISCLDMSTSGDVHIGGELSCYDATCSDNIEANSINVAGQVVAKTLEVEDDIVVAGISIDRKLRELEELLRASQQNSVQNVPVRFSRRQYFADTQYDIGHDQIQAISPAFPYQQMRYDFPTALTQGLAVTELGQVVGRGSYAGSFPIETRASVKQGGDTYTLQIDAQFTIFGPAEWITSVRNGVVQRRPFRITLAAQDASSFDGCDPYVDGVSCIQGGLSGTLSSPGVYRMGAVALRHLAHNDHVLRNERTFETTVHPVEPFVNDVTGVMSVGVALELHELLQGTEDNATSLTLSQTDPGFESVEWLTDESVFTQVSTTFDFELLAPGAITYDIVARKTLPLYIRLSADGHLLGSAPDPVEFDVCVRAQGSGGPHRPVERGGHVDRDFKVTIRPMFVDFSALHSYGESLNLHSGDGPIVFEVENPQPRRYSLRVNGLS